MKFLPIILIVGLFLVVLLSGCVTDSGAVVEKQNKISDDPTNTQAQTEKITNIENAKVGQTYTVDYLKDKFDVTLQEISFEEYAGYSIDKHYLLAFFEIKNSGTKTLIMMPNIYVLDNESEKYDNTIAFGLDQEKYSKELSFLKDLPPTAKTSGWVAFEIPEDKNKFSMYFEYSNQFLDDVPKYIKWDLEKK